MDDVLIILGSFLLAGALIGFVWLLRTLILCYQKRWEHQQHLSQLTTCPKCKGTGGNHPLLCGMCYGKGRVSSSYLIELDNETVVTADEFNSLESLREKYEQHYEEVS